jgi:hypothetical protein
MRLLAVVVGLLVLLAPARTRADAQIAEWIGEYAMIHDGHRGTLRIADSKADCATTPWCHLVVSYTGPDGRRLGARIRQIDQRFQHMALDIAFPGNMQRFDAYIMSWDKTRMAGTTVWGGRTFGFYATKSDRPVAVRPVRERPELATPPTDTQPADQPLASTPAEAPTIAADGSIETPLPDGSKRITRPGVCGWTIVFPDGKRSVVSCNQVQPATPPVPSGASADWLTAHSESLLEIARALLGDNASTVNNYLQTAESGQPGVYDRIRLRTDLIAKLTAPM